MNAIEVTTLPQELVAFDVPHYVTGLCHDSHRVQRSNKAFLRLFEVALIRERHRLAGFPDDFERMLRRRLSFWMEMLIG